MLVPENLKENKENYAKPKILGECELWHNNNQAFSSSLENGEWRKKSSMDFIYNAMDEAKELIAHNWGGDEPNKEIWEIINEKWEF